MLEEEGKVMQKTEPELSFLLNICIKLWSFYYYAVVSAGGH